MISLRTREYYTKVVLNNNVRDFEAYFVSGHLKYAELVVQPAFLKFRGELMKSAIISNYFFTREMTKNLLGEEFPKCEISMFDIEYNINIQMLEDTDLFILDIVSHREKFIKLLDDIKKYVPKAKIMIYTNSNNISVLMESKADAYVSKINDKMEFKFIMDKVMNSHKYYDSKLMDVVIENKEDCRELDKLTSREKEILMNIGKGFTNKVISEKLSVTEYTVKKHISSIFNKLKLKNRSEAIVYLQGTVI